jgi:hypothetical protein
MKSAVFSALFLGSLSLAPAAPKEFSSGPARVHVIELFTSEGCSSCPPADEWLGNLRDQRGLWTDFVPLGWHVDYWNQLGWPDRFSTKEFTAREYAYSGAWGSDSVYTPCFVLDGKEMTSRALPEGDPAAKAGLLTATVGDDRRVTVRFAGAGSGEVHAALLGAGITSKVRAGENRGRELRHDFVVLRIVSAPLHNGVADLVLPDDRDSTVPRHAVAIWITRTGKLAPLQATGGWLD